MKNWMESWLGFPLDTTLGVTPFQILQFLRCSRVDTTCRPLPPVGSIEAILAFPRSLAMHMYTIGISVQTRCPNKSRQPEKARYRAV